ncbi:MAG: hypothetical protein IPP71_06645 [Bacteroidetes bacterium]|nr:hypothetical protein [Bacteroidota bacterium]
MPVAIINANFIKTIPIAHRGLHTNDGIIPENSLAAFQKAIDENYLIEIDVHILADNQVIVFHDDNTKRMCGLDKKIRNLTFPEIKSLRLLETHHEIPTLLEVFDLVNGKVPILIELKTKIKLDLLNNLYLI